MHNTEQLSQDGLLKNTLKKPLTPKRDEKNETVHAHSNGKATPYLQTPCSTQSMGRKHVQKMAGKKEWVLYKEVEGHKYPQEDLNIERHWRIMVTHALRKNQNVKKASADLGITERTVFRLIKRWEIEWKLPDLEVIEKNTR